MQILLLSNKNLQMTFWMLVFTVADQCTFMCVCVCTRVCVSIIEMFKY